MEKVGEICLILLGEAPNEIKHISPTFSLHDERGFVHVLLLLLLVLLGLNASFPVLSNLPRENRFWDFSYLKDC